MLAALHFRTAIELLLCPKLDREIIFEEHAHDQSNAARVHFVMSFPDSTTLFSVPGFFEKKRPSHILKIAAPVPPNFIVA